VEYDRRVLIVDGPEGHLQRLALDLLSRNLAVHYANDPAEAQLLAREAHGSIGAVLFGPEVGLGRIPDMARRLGVTPATLVPTGSRPPRREIAAMAFHGVRWHLWDEPSDETIRFVLSIVMGERDPLDLRFHPRVPTRLAGTLEIDEQKGDVAIRDLSLGGACLLGRVLGDPGARGQLRFEIEGETLELPSRIAWSVAGAGDELGVAGVAFSEVDAEAGDLLDRHVEAILSARRVVASERDGD
jgi:hypothetical protein